MSSALVSVLVTDANDNAPIFEQKSYEFSVKEDARAGELMGKLIDYFKINVVNLKSNFTFFTSEYYNFSKCAFPSKY